MSQASDVRGKNKKKINVVKTERAQQDESHFSLKKQ
jgi:hypothetical protein